MPPDTCEENKEMPDDVVKFAVEFVQHIISDASLVAAQQRDRQLEELPKEDFTSQ